MDVLRVASIQSPNADSICEMIAGYLGSRLGLRTEWLGNIPWQDRERLLDEGQIHVGWICGLPYDQKADQAQPTVELLAVPVMQGPRCQDRPIYFSDVVVRHDSSTRRLRICGEPPGPSTSPIPNRGTTYLAITWRRWAK